MMENCSRRSVALFFLILIPLLQSCGGTPAPPPESHSIPTTAGVMTEPDEDTEWTLLLDPASPPKKPEPAPAKLAAEPESQIVWPESVISSPATDAVAATLKYDTLVSERPAPVPGSRGWQFRKNRRNQIVGFELSNRGGNRILAERRNISKNQLYTRDFQFRFDDRAKQDIHLSITDWVPSRDKQFRLSNLMNSVLLFFPRNFVPAIAAFGNSTVVTLPTGEKVEFDAKTYEVVNGVFEEAPVALSTPRFPAVKYIGKGLTVRVDSRGNDPRIATVATITTGSPDPNCVKGQGCSQCRVAAKDLWDQKDSVRFKFATDEDFDRYLRARCGFGIPRLGSEFLLVSSPGDSRR